MHFEPATEESKNNEFHIEDKIMKFLWITFLDDSKSYRLSSRERILWGAK